jgi:tRNA1Val (adenine37-N6)-methyltransferase
LLRNYRIEPKSIRFIQSYINKAPNLVLIKAIKDAGEKLTVETPLIVYNTDGTYTDEILKIYNKKV